MEVTNSVIGFVLLSIGGFGWWTMITATGFNEFGRFMVRLILLSATLIAAPLLGLLMVYAK